MKMARIVMIFYVLLTAAIKVGNNETPADSGSHQGSRLLPALSAALSPRPNKLVLKGTGQGIIKGAAPI